MPIIVNLDVMMAKRKISAGELAERIDITPANLSILKNNRARAVRFSTLEAICEALDCQPGDILEFIREEKNDETQEDSGRGSRGSGDSRAGCLSGTG
ncbi:MAG: helix-turn-helix transcriptional regulator [Oscillospiraceae bacterium]|nr:helix-turn-helix transcriptional regulator [Oscillospiraceae bacterium]